MHRVLKKDQIFTIPNLLSLVRLSLIPIIVWLYCGAENYEAAVAVIIASGITDVADGIIARKFNMVSDFGKILDPVADKLTQAAIILCLTVKYKLMWMLIAVFALREISMTVAGCIVLKRTDRVNSARWYGKISTVMLYSVLSSMILFPNVAPATANTLIIASCVMILMSLTLYMRFYVKLLKTA